MIAFGSLGGWAHRTAGQHGRGDAGRAGKGIGRFLALIRVAVSAAGFVIQVWLTTAHPSLPRDWICVIDVNADESRLDGLNHSHGDKPCLRDQLFRISNIGAALHRGQDNSGSALPSAAERLHAGSETVRRCHRRPHGQRNWGHLSLSFNPGGLPLTFAQLSYVSLGLTASPMWCSSWPVAPSAGPLTSFRQSFERHDIEAAQVRVNVADLSTVETLVEELSSPDEQHGSIAIDLLRIARQTRS